MADSKPEPDEFGWLRVTDKDTGHKSSIRESQLAHGNYTVLKQDASNPLTGEPLPPEFHDGSASSGSASSTPASTTSKES